MRENAAVRPEMPVVSQFKVSRRRISLKYFSILYVQYFTIIDCPQESPRPTQSRSLKIVLLSLLNVF